MRIAEEHIMVQVRKFQFYFGDKGHSILIVATDLPYAFAPKGFCLKINFQLNCVNK